MSKDPAMPGWIVERRCRSPDGAAVWWKPRQVAPRWACRLGGLAGSDAAGCAGGGYRGQRRNQHAKRDEQTGAPAWFGRSSGLGCFGGRCSSVGGGRLLGGPLGGAEPLSGNIGGGLLLGAGGGGSQVHGPQRGCEHE